MLDEVRSDHGHEGVGTFELVEQRVKLVQSQLGVHSLFLVPLVKKLHLEEDHALATVR